MSRCNLTFLSPRRGPTITSRSPTAARRAGWAAFSSTTSTTGPRMRSSPSPRCSLLTTYYLLLTCYLLTYRTPDEIFAFSKVQPTCYLLPTYLLNYLPTYLLTYLPTGPRMRSSPSPRCSLPTTYLPTYVLPTTLYLLLTTYFALSKASLD